MKAKWSDLTPEQQATFGNGCTWVPDFIYGDICRIHDFDYMAGGGLSDKMESDYRRCFAMFDRACDSNRPFFYGLVAVIYYCGLTILPISHFFFTWGRYQTLEEILERDMMDKTHDI